LNYELTKSRLNSRFTSKTAGRPDVNVISDYEEDADIDHDYTAITGYDFADLDYGLVICTITNKDNSNADVDIDLYNTTNSESIVDDSITCFEDEATTVVMGFDIDDFHTNNYQTFDIDYELRLTSDDDIDYANVSSHVIHFTTHYHNNVFAIIDNPEDWNVSDIIISIDKGDGNGYVDKTSDIEGVNGLNRALNSGENDKEQNIDITNLIGKTSGWKGIRILPDGACRIRGDVFIQIFIQSKT
jgi:hypothetical protein